MGTRTHTNTNTNTHARALAGVEFGLRNLDELRVPKALGQRNRPIQPGHRDRAESLCQCFSCDGLCPTNKRRSRSPPFQCPTPFISSTQESRVPPVSWRSAVWGLARSKLGGCGQNSKRSVRGNSYLTI